MEAKEGGDPARGRAGAAACSARGGLGAAFGAWGVIIRVIIWNVHYFALNAIEFYCAVSRYHEIFLLPLAESLMSCILQHQQSSSYIIHFQNIHEYIKQG